MVRRALEFRAPLNLVVATGVGVVGLRSWPFPVDNVFLTVIDARKPWLFDGLGYLSPHWTHGRVGAAVRRGHAT